MKYKLEEMAEVLLGYQARGRIVATPGGSHRLIQFKDIDALDGIVKDGLLTIKPERDVEKCLVNLGDILFASRGSRNFACVVERAYENTVAAGNFYIIRSRNSSLLPVYAAWYINLPKTQARIQEMAQGQSIQLVSVSALRSLEIDVPPIKVQQKIAMLYSLCRKEQILTRQLLEKRELLVQVACENAIS